MGPHPHLTEYRREASSVEPSPGTTDSIKTGGKVKCTYEDCFKRFKTEEAMKKHKTKDPDHFYCKRCDHDCEDDMDYLYHQIVSYKHIACPQCGTEFEGSAARDAHVETVR